jgi:hypothetical protein
MTSPEIPAGSPMVIKMLLTGFIDEGVEYPRPRGSFHANSAAARPLGGAAKFFALV